MKFLLSFIIAITIDDVFCLIDLCKNYQTGNIEENTRLNEECDRFCSNQVLPTTGFCIFGMGCACRTLTPRQPRMKRDNRLRKHQMASPRSNEEYLFDFDVPLDHFARAPNRIENEVQRRSIFHFEDIFGEYERPAKIGTFLLIGVGVVVVLYFGHRMHTASWREKWQSVYAIPVEVRAVPKKGKNATNKQQTTTSTKLHRMLP